jgi:hypothetical protein
VKGTIFSFELDGKTALGFDTGLDAQAFAQAKMAQFITQPGYLVSQGGVEEWKPSGVIERDGNTEGGGASMVIWGPHFEGERLDHIINDQSRKDQALRALRDWMDACLLRDKKDAAILPAGTLVSPGGAVLFPPPRLVLRCLQAEGSSGEAQAYVHPDLEGKQAAAFSAAAMLYRILAGVPAFKNDDEETLRQDIREKVYLPLRLACPGVDDTLSAIVDKAFNPPKESKTANNFALIREVLGTEKCPPAASFVRSLGDEERKIIENNRLQFEKKKNTRVKTRRFVIRNTAVILGIAAAVIIAALVARSIIAGRADLPTTAGMESARVVESYYQSFGALDHQMMEACVTSKAGKDDITMVTNFFVLTKVRQAYEFGVTPVIPAQEWIDSGSQPSEIPVFGVSGLTIEKLSGGEASDEIRYRSSYTLWLPASAAETDAPPEPVSSVPETLPAAHTYTDEITLIRVKGAWRISEIKRSQGSS